MKLLESLGGKRTYLVALAMIVVVMAGVGGAELPEELWRGLMAVAIWFLRAAVAKAEA